MSQDGDAHRVYERGASVAMAGAATSIRIVFALKAATACAAYAATFTASAYTGSCNLCRHRQLNSHRLGTTGGQETVRRAPHITLLDEVLEGGVQARWSVVGEEPEAIMEVPEGDRGEVSRLG